MKRMVNLRLKTGLASLALAVTLSGCFSFGDNFTVRTKVNADGSLDRTVSFSSYDSISHKGLQFGAADSTGWTGHVEKNMDSTKDGKFNITLTKHYRSVDDANADLVSRKDGYRITSKVETQYRWFFTTMYFSETYAPTMTISGVSPDDFFSPEELQWFEGAFRGDTIVTADSVLGVAMKKKMDSYLAYAVAAAQAKELGGQMLNEGIEQRWVDTLNAHVSDLADLLQQDDASKETGWTYLIDTLKLPIGSLRNSKWVDEGIILSGIPLFDEIEHIIEIPAVITNSNSQHLGQRTATWYITPFAGITRGVLFVESRKLNYPEIIGTLFALAALILFRRKRSQ